jgi:transglutaminase-like putative cysteine protease
MASLLLKLLNHLRPREGWPPLLLLLVAVTCLPAALHSPGDGSSLFLLAIAASLAGLRLARSRLAAPSSGIAGALAGIMVVVATVGRLWPSPALLGREVTATMAWLRGAQGGAAPLSTLGNFFWQRGSALWLRLWWWGQRAASGAGTQDSIALELLLAGLVWGLSLLAGWQIYRRRAALAGLLPVGVALALIAFFRGGMSYFYLFTFLGCTLALIATCRLWRSRARWDAEGTDYPGDMGLELAFSVAPWVTALLVLGFLFPVVQVRPVRDAIWRVLDAPWARVEQAAERYFGPIDSGYPRPAAGRGGEGLPRAHLLGGGPELGRTIVLTVVTDDPPPAGSEDTEGTAAAPRRYWRGITYDIYTGQGWRNSPLESTLMPAGRPMEGGTASGHYLAQQFELLAPEGQRLYAVNAPFYLDTAVQARSRAGDDLAELWSNTRRYAVVSRASEPTVAELRASSAITRPLPATIADRYLALPETVPQRVLDLARRVAGQAPTRYDRARNIERYLRAYPYTLDLPQPPRDRDLVDYFLFELQEGYCDYDASAMVVMARAAGVPARLATGYAQGTYDPESQHWVVTEENGHSWVEVYFEGIGWVEFEPTAGLPALERPGSDAAAVPLPALPPPPLRWWQQVPWGLVGLAAGMALLVGLVAWLWRPRPVPGAGDLVRNRYARLLRWGRRLRRPLRDGQTAQEYGRALGQVLERRGREARWPGARRAAAEAPDQVVEVVEALTAVQYSPHPLNERRAWRVRELWNHLRRHLRWLWLTTRNR